MFQFNVRTLSQLVIIICLASSCFWLPAINAQSNRGDMSLENFLSQSNTPFRQKWQKPAPESLTNKISNDASYLAMLDYMKQKEMGQGTQGTYDYWEQFNENYHSWDFCPYTNTRIGEYLKPDQVTDRCCICNNGWQCQFEPRSFAAGDEFRQCLSPDLALQNLVITNAEITPGLYEVSLSFNAKNTGSGKLQAFEIVLYQDETEIGRQTFSGLEPQQTRLITHYDFDLPPDQLNLSTGDYVFSVTGTLLSEFETSGGSTSDIFIETDETNNSLEKTLSLTAPNMTVTDIIITPKREVIGQSQKNLVSVSIQSPGSYLDQSTIINLTLIQADGNETTIATETRNIFQDANTNTSLVDIELFLPFGDFLIRAEILPQQYDENPSDNIYEEAISITSPDFTPITLSSIQSIIFEAGNPKIITPGEVLYLSANGTTDVMRFSAKTNLLADVDVTWQALDTNNTIIPPVSIINYSTGFGHGAEFQFNTPGQYTIQGIFTDIYNDNNQEVFDISSITISPLISIETIVGTKKEDNITSEFLNNSKLILKNEPENSLIFVTDSSLKESGYISWELKNLETGEKFLPDIEYNYEIGNGYKVQFNEKSSWQSGNYSLRASVSNSNTVTTSNIFSEFFFELEFDTISPYGVKDAYIIKNGEAESFFETKTITISPTAGFQSFIFEINHPYDPSMNIISSIEGGIGFPAHPLLDNSGYGIEYFILNLENKPYTLNLSLSDGNNNVIPLPDFTFQVSVLDQNTQPQPSPLGPLEVRAYKNTNFINHEANVMIGDVVEFYLKSPHGAEVNRLWEILDSEGDFVTSYSELPYNTNGWGIKFIPQVAGTFTINGKISHLSDPADFIWSDPFVIYVQ